MAYLWPDRCHPAATWLSRRPKSTLLFVVAVVVFFLGLGIGLAFNPIIGLILWVVAPAIAVSNLLWILRRVAALKGPALTPALLNVREYVIPSPHYPLPRERESMMLGASPADKERVNAGVEPATKGDLEQLRRDIVNDLRHEMHFRMKC